MDYGRIILFLGVALYFSYKFFKHRQIGDLILTLLGIYGITSGRFILEQWNKTIFNGSIFNFLNWTILIVLFILISIYFSKKKSN